MKICWDNLEKLEYNKNKKGWYDKYWNFYIYKECCKNCGQPFLDLNRNKENYCCSYCANAGKNHPMWNKKHSIETKQKMSKTRKNIKFSEEHKQKLGKKLENNPNWKGGYYTNNIPMFDTYASQINFCENIVVNGIYQQETK